MIPSFWANEGEWKQLVASTVNPMAGGYVKVGYSRGGAVTQATSKSTGVTLNALSGDITMNAASLAATTAVSFTLTNNAITADDQLFVTHQSAGTFGSYDIKTQCAAGSATIRVYNNTGGALAEAIVLRFSVFKCSTDG